MSTPSSGRSRSNSPSRTPTNRNTRSRSPCPRWDLTVFGVGVIIGTGIFVLTGNGRRDNAGPAVAISFVARRHRLRPRGPLLRRVRLHGAGRRHRRTPSPTPRSASWSPGSSAGTWCSSSPSARRWWPSAGPATSRSCSTTRLASAGRALRPTSPRLRLRLLAVALVLVLTVILVLGTKLSARVTWSSSPSRWRSCSLVIIAGPSSSTPANYLPFIPPEPRRPGGDGLTAAADPADVRLRTRRLRRLRHLRRPRPWCSSPSSASTSWPPPPRRPGTRSATCRAASSARWSSAPCSTSRCPSS